MVSDTLGDFIIRLKNAGAIGKQTVAVRHSKLLHAVAEKLKELGYVTAVAKEGKEKPQLVVTLAYDERGTHKISDVRRLSKPGRRLYAKVADAHRVKNGRGALILTTPRGILTDEEARKLRAGGEKLFSIW